MAIKAEAVATSTSAALIFTSDNGHSEAAQDLVIRNDDGTDTVYIGGVGVDATDGYPVGPGLTLTIPLMSGDAVYAIASANTPELRLVYNRV